MPQVKKLESDGLFIENFEVLTQQAREIPPIRFKNTLAEYLFPDSTFSLTSFYKKNTPEQLEEIGGEITTIRQRQQGLLLGYGQRTRNNLPHP